MLEKARQAERLDAERTAARERYERYREAVEVSTELDELAQTHPSPNPLPVVRQAVERLRVLDTRIRELQCRARRRDRRQLRGRAGADMAAAVALGPRGGRRRAGRRGWRLPARAPRASSTSAWPRCSSVSRSPLIGVDPDRRRAVAAARFAHATRSCATSRSTGDCAAGPRWRPSFARPRRTRPSSSGPSGSTTLPRPRTCSAARRRTSPGWTSCRPSSTVSSARSRARRCPTLRDAAALEIEQKTSALESLGPIAKEPRARERLEVEVRDQEGALERARDDEANARARVENNTVDAEQVAAEAEQLAVLARAARRCSSAVSASSTRRCAPSSAPRPRR